MESSFVRFIYANDSAAGGYWNVLLIIEVDWLVHCSATESFKRVCIQYWEMTLDTVIFHFYDVLMIELIFIFCENLTVLYDVFFFLD